VGNAIQRNRARRLLREAVRQLYHAITSGWDIVLIARSELSAQKGVPVEEALWSLLQRAQLLSSPDVEHDAGAVA
jgi:ribonuclease P protein component